MSRTEQAAIVKRLLDLVGHDLACAMIIAGPGCTCGIIQSQAIARADGVRLYRWLTKVETVASL